MFGRSRVQGGEDMSIGEKRILYEAFVESELQLSTDVIARI